MSIQGIAQVIDAMGSGAFDATLLGFLRRACGADHCVVYSRAEGAMKVVAAASADGSPTAQANAARYAREGFWERDPAVQSALFSPVAEATRMTRLEASSIRDAEFREYFYDRPQICEKAFLSGRRSRVWLGASVFRGRRRGPFSPAELGRLAAHAELLVSCFARHAAFVTAQADGHADLSSVPRIEGRLRLLGIPFSRRELDVCARLLFGMPAPAIARELGIDVETVVTYRRRAMQKANVETRQQLLRLFVGGQRTS